MNTIVFQAPVLRNMCDLKRNTKEHINIKLVCKQLAYNMYTIFILNSLVDKYKRRVFTSCSMSKNIEYHKS